MGNSITYGYGIDDRGKNSYATQLQKMLGSKYAVGNFGHSGATLLTNGHRPYIKQEAFRNALAFVPDIAVVHLGINDTDPRNWPNYSDEFIKDYLSLIRQFRDVNPAVRIIIARMSPILPSHPRFESGTREWYAEIQQAIERVIVTFKEGGGELHASDAKALRGWEIAEYDGLFYPAEAKLSPDRKSVMVSVGSLSKPKFVRYAWAPYTDANLVNEADLPASTFVQPVVDK